MKSLLIAAIFSLFTFSAVHAQTDEPDNSDFWEARLPGGNYLVSLRTISSVSMHTYMIDAGLKVTEVVVDTTGNSLARFYYIIPVTANGPGAGLTTRGKELIDNLGKKVDVAASSTVVKQYPLTTHAKTVEFAIADEKSIQALYSSVKSSWLRGSGKTFTIRE